MVAAALSIGLFYPAMVYGDLAGMGGYDRLASAEMMRHHGVWAPTTSGPTGIYCMFEALSLLWFISLASLPVSVIIVVRQIIQERRGEAKDWQLQKDMGET